MQPLVMCAGSSSNLSSSGAAAVFVGCVACILLFFDNSGVRRRIDFALQRTALVVADIDRSSELDESLIEHLRSLLGPDLVFDLPECFINSAQLFHQRFDAGLGDELACGRPQKRPFAPDIG